MKQILVTIDTEVGELGRTLPTAFETFIQGDLHGEQWGYEKIITLLDRYHAQGEFFVDVYPVEQFGEKRFATLCQTITKAGHAVQLHTHPASQYDPAKRYLADYTLAEQEEIIACGVTRIETWTGIKPVAHRAGGYGVSSTSLAALEKTGFLYDSSFYFGNEHCCLPLVKKNAPYKIGSLWEIPVTGYQQNLSYCLLGLPLLHRQHFQKLDFRYGSTAQEIIEAIQYAPETSIQVIFLHSFNFLDLRYNLKTKHYNPITPLPGLVEEFETLLKWIATDPACQFSCFANLNLTENEEDYLPVIPSKRQIVPHLQMIAAEKLCNTVTT